MRFKIDQTKRPKVIKEDGIVVFEHYTRKSAEGPDQLELTETTPTKEECLAYGFRYNDDTNECLCKNVGYSLRTNFVILRFQKFNLFFR